MASITQDEQIRPTSPTSSSSSSPTGWTTIHPHSRYTRRYRPSQGTVTINDEAAQNSGKKKKKDLSFALALTPRSTTLEILRKDYAKHKSDLASTKFWTNITTFITGDLRSKAWNWSTKSCETEKQKIRKVVCLGLGSMSSVVGWRISLDQLAYLELLLESLLDEGIVVEKYAQDPAFNDLDQLLLREMGYRVVKDPQGFEVIDEDTLVFAPHLDHVFTHQFWLRNPSVAVCNDVMIWGNTMSIQEYVEKYPAFDEVIEKYQKFILPKSNEVNNGRAFNDTVVYWSPNSVAIDVALKFKEENEVVAAGIKVSVTPPSRENSPMGNKRATTGVGKDVFVNTVKSPATTATTKESGTITATTTTVENNGERIFLGPTPWIPIKEQGFIGFRSFRSFVTPKHPPIPFHSNSSPSSELSGGGGKDDGSRMAPTPAKGFSAEQMRNRFKNRNFAKPVLRRRDAGFHPLEGNVIMESEEENEEPSSTEQLHSSPPVLSISFSTDPSTATKGAGCGYESSDSQLSNSSLASTDQSASPFSSPSSACSNASSTSSSPSLEKQRFSFEPTFPSPVSDDEALKSPPFISLDPDSSCFSLSSCIFSPLTPSLSPTTSEPAANDGILGEKDQNQQTSHGQGSLNHDSEESTLAKPIPVPTAMMTMEVFPKRREEGEQGAANQTSGWVEARANKPERRLEVRNVDSPDKNEDEDWTKISPPTSDDPDALFSDSDLIENVAIEDLEALESNPLDDLVLSSSPQSYLPEPFSFNPFRDLDTSPISFPDHPATPPLQPRRRCLLEEEDWDEDDDDIYFTYGGYREKDAWEGLRADNVRDECTREDVDGTLAGVFFQQGGHGGGYFRWNPSGEKNACLLRGFARGEGGRG